MGVFEEISKTFPQEPIIRNRHEMMPNSPGFAVGAIVRAAARLGAVRTEFALKGACRTARHRPLEQGSNLDSSLPPHMDTKFTRSYGRLWSIPNAPHDSWTVGGCTPIFKKKRKVAQTITTHFAVALIEAPGTRHGESPVL